MFIILEDARDARKTMVIHWIATDRAAITLGIKVAENAGTVK